MYTSPAALAAFAATGAISLAPNIILLLLPGFAAGEGETSAWLALGQAMGAGGLLADVFLHTLAETSATDGTTAAGVYILVGFVIFFAVDLLVRSVNDDGAHAHGHANNHSHSSSSSTMTSPEPYRENGDATPANTPRAATKRSIVLLNLAADALHNFTDGLAIGASYAIVDPTLSSTTKSAASVTVWSMLKSHSRGGFATLSILFHEVPHELST